VGVTLIANHAVGRIQFTPLRHLPVETFPTQIGNWSAKKTQSVSKEVQQKLPSAHIENRVYTGPGGQQIDVLLLSATEYTDFHDPTWCFPGQGFKISKPEPLTIGNRAAQMMTAQRDGSRMRVLYWWNGQITTKYAYGREQISRLLELRNKFAGERGQSLFFRLVMEDTPDSAEVLKQFAVTCLPALDALEKAPVEQTTARR